MAQTKKCSECGKELPLDRFFKSNSTADGLRDYCKRCGIMKARKRLYSPNLIIYINE